VSAAESPLEPLPPAPSHAAGRLGPDAIDRLTRYGEALATDGVTRGLIGPREVPILWDRHLLNCAAMAEAVPQQSRVADIGTGAGLPGMVLALIRPDLEIVLVDTLQRRCEFLEEMVTAFDLSPRVSVIWGRAEEIDPLQADIVTSRAVAALNKLVRWSFPHLKIGGRLLAIKGQKAPEEITAARQRLAQWGAGKDVEVITCGEGWIDPAVNLVSATRRR